MSVGYANTLIQVAADCPTDRAVVPTSRGGRKTVAFLEYELLSAHPYRLTNEDLIFEVHVRRLRTPPEDLEAQSMAIRAELFRKPHPCMRASPLPKTYGWGIHYDGDGRMGLLAVESDEYRAFIERRDDRGFALVPAMRNRRGQ